MNGKTAGVKRRRPQTASSIDKFQAGIRIAKNINGAPLSEVIWYPINVSRILPRNRFAPVRAHGNRCPIVRPHIWLLRPSRAKTGGGINVALRPSICCHYLAPVRAHCNGCPSVRTKAWLTHPVHAIVCGDINETTIVKTILPSHHSAAICAHCTCQPVARTGVVACEPVHSRVGGDGKKTGKPCWIQIIPTLPSQHLAAICAYGNKSPRVLPSIILLNPIHAIIGGSINVTSPAGIGTVELPGDHPATVCAYCNRSPSSQTSIII